MHASLVVRVRLEVSDDGIGFHPEATTSGFGLAGLRGCVQPSGGELTVTSGMKGTIGRAELPLSAIDEPVVEGVAHQIGA